MIYYACGNKSESTPIRSQGATHYTNPEKIDKIDLMEHKTSGRRKEIRYEMRDGEPGRSAGARLSGPQGTNALDGQPVLDIEDVTHVLSIFPF